MTRRVVVRVASRDLGLASVRYRGLLPACAFRRLGWHVEVSSGADTPPAQADLAWIVKPLSSKEAAWATRCSGAGIPSIVDICDNVFLPTYGNSDGVIRDRFLATAEAATMLAVPTAALRDEVVQATGRDPSQVAVVPDIVETDALLQEQARLIGSSVHRPLLARIVARLARGRRGRTPRLLWFGNHGAPYADFGLTDLLLFHDALEQAHRRFGAELWVVSNHREKFESLAARLPIPSHYREWTPTLVDDLLRQTDVCLVPNSLDAFSRTKSANRALKALQAGVPVVATPTSAYAGLEGVWLDEPAAGIAAYLDDPALRAAHLSAARRSMAAQFSMEALMGHVAQLAQSAGTRARTA